MSERNPERQEPPEDTEPLGRLEDDDEEAAPSDDEGAAARGEYDPAQGSPSGAHPVGEAFPAEAARYDEPKHRRATSD